jgi:hypothetical protein
MDSGTDTLAGRFPHSEILGSKPVCRLPEAYRRLPRPSSPLAAKASTLCAYSLDHITPKSLLLTKKQNLKSGINGTHLTVNIHTHRAHLRALKSP